MLRAAVLAFALLFVAAQGDDKTAGSNNDGDARVERSGRPESFPEENNTNDTEVDMWWDEWESKNGGQARDPEKNGSVEVGHVKTTSFIVQVKLQGVDDFVPAEFRRAMATALGVAVEDVSMEEANFTISTSMTFATVVTKEEATEAIAIANAVDVSAVDVVVSEARRLADGEQRRLGTKVDVSITIPVKNSTQATSVMASLGDVAALATELGLPADDIVVEKPSLAVQVSTVVKTVEAEAVKPPTKEAFEDGLKTVAPDKTFEVGEVSKPTYAILKAEDDSTTTSTPAGDDDDDDDDDSKTTSKPEGDDDDDDDDDDNAAFGMSVYSAQCALAVLLVANMQRL